MEQNQFNLGGWQIVRYSADFLFFSGKIRNNIGGVIMLNEERGNTLRIQYPRVPRVPTKYILECGVVRYRLKIDLWKDQRICDNRISRKEFS